MSVVAVQHGRVPRVAVGRTPRRLVRRDGAASLWFYPSRRASRAPVLMVYAMVNRPFVLDLLPGVSVIERFLKAGHPVYLHDWGEPRPEDAGRGLDEFISGVLGRSVDAVRWRSGEPPVLFGYCQGGVFSAVYAALFPASVSRLILVATPADFREMGTLSGWARPGEFDVERLCSAFGNVPSTFLYAAFECLKPLRTQQGEADFLHGLATGRIGPEEEERFLALERWKKEGVAHPGAAFKEFVTRFFFKNDLLRNRLRVGSRRVDLRRVSCPALVVAGEKDHLVPPAAALPMLRLLGSARKEAIRFPAGHVGLSVGARSHRELWPRVIDWIGGAGGPARGKA